MSEIIIKATKRTVTGKKVKNLRNEGILPGIIYGRNIEPLPISLNARDSRFLKTLSPSILVTVQTENENHVTLIRDKQFNVLIGELIHIDLQAVSLTEKIRSWVSIELVGEAPVVAELEALIVLDTEEIEVEALPQNLPEKFIVDISSLKNIGDNILVSTVTVPEGVEILSDPDTVLVIATSTYVAEEEEEELDEEFDELEEPEVIERGRAEEEEED